MERQEDKVIGHAMESINNSADRNFYLHDSQRVTSNETIYNALGQDRYDSPEVELTPDQLQGKKFNWENRTATSKEPAKKGTVFSTVVELGKKIVPAKLRGGK